MLGAFAEFERAMIRERIMAGLRRTSNRSGRKPMGEDRAAAIQRSLADGQGTRATARRHAASPTTVTRIAREMAVGGDNTASDQAARSAVARRRLANTQVIFRRRATKNFTLKYTTPTSK